MLGEIENMNNWNSHSETAKRLGYEARMLNKGGDLRYINPFPHGSLLWWKFAEGWMDRDDVEYNQEFA